MSPNGPAIESWRWVVLGVLFLARTVIGFQFQTVASTTPYLLAGLHVSYVEIGTLIGLYSLPGILMALPASLFNRRLGDKRTCAAGLVLMMVGGLLMGISDGFLMASVARIVSGTGAVVFGQALTIMVTDWFAGREIVFAMGVFLSSWPLGIAAGLIFQGSMAAAFGWQSVMNSAALVCGAALLLIVIAYRTAPTSPNPAPSPRRQPAGRWILPTRQQILPVSIAGVIWANLNLGLVMFFSFAPAMLIEHGLPAARAAALTSLALWILMVSLPLGGYLVQRSGRSDAAIVAFCSAAALLLILLPAGALPFAVCAAFGFAVGPAAGPIMALPVRVLDPGHRAAGLGVFMTWYYVILTFGPALGGLLRDLWGSSVAAILLGSALFVAIPPLLLLFRSLEASERATKLA